MRYPQTQNIISTVDKIEIKDLDQCFGYYDLNNQGCLSCNDSVRCRRIIWVNDEIEEGKECFGDWQGNINCLFCQSQPFCRLEKRRKEND